jgi:hypothetical protein
MCWTSLLIRLPLAGTLAALLMFANNASALTWKSSDYNCQVELPQGEPITGGKSWSPIGSTQEGTLVGAMRVDGSAYVFLGMSISRSDRNFISTTKQSKNSRRDFSDREWDFGVRLNVFR